MRAVQVTRLDGPSAVAMAEVDPPEPESAQALIDVHAAGVTFPDLLLSKGQYQLKPALPFVLGSELAGVVRTAPEGSGLQPGDRVVAFATLGGWADTVAVDPARVFALPAGTSFQSGAGVPMNYLTVHFALRRRGRLRPGETVLVHGAAGGVGTAAVQLATVLGARVIGVVSTDAKAEVARAAGAAEVVTGADFRAAVEELTAGRGVDLVVDPVGGGQFTDSLRCLAPEGRLLVVGFTAGEIPTVRVNRLLLNNIDVVGVGWGAFALSRPDYLREQWSELVPHLESGALSPVLGASYPLEQAGEALAQLEERRATGKLTLTLR